MRFSHFVQKGKKDIRMTTNESGKFGEQSKDCEPVAFQMLSYISQYPLHFFMIVWAPGKYSLPISRRSNISVSKREEN